MKSKNWVTHLISMILLIFSGVCANTTAHAESDVGYKRNSEPDQKELGTSVKSLLFDLEKTLELKLNDVSAISTATKQMRKLADQDPRALQSFVRAFGRSGTKTDREKARSWAERNSLLRADDQESVAIWGVVGLIAIAILVGNGCDGEGGCGGSCPTAGPCPNNGSSGGTD